MTIFLAIDAIGNLQVDHNWMEKVYLITKILFPCLYFWIEFLFQDIG